MEFKSEKILLLGPEGIALEEFLGNPLGKWIKRGRNSK